MTDLTQAERRYVVLRSAVTIFATLGALLFAVVLLWVSVATLQIVEDVSRFTTCGSIPARESVVLHRNNAERLNRLLNEHGMATQPLPPRAIFPPECEEN